MNDETTDSRNRFNAMETRLRLLEDRQAIHEVILRYCRGVDRSDPDLILSAFHDDAIDCVFRARKASDSRHAGPWFRAMSVQCS